MVSREKLLQWQTANEARIRRMVIWVYLIGLAGLGYAVTREYFQYLIPLNLIFGFVVLALFDEASRIKEGLIYLFILLGGFAVEAVGVATGKIFGVYSYGTILGPRLFSTPLIIGVNWLLISYCAYAVSSMLIKKNILRPFFAAAIMVALDVLIEPVAIKLGMWSWADVNPPLQNYIAWFVISLFFQFLLRFSRIRISNRMAPVLLGAMAGFFLLLKVIFIYIG